VVARNIAPRTDSQQLRSVTVSSSVLPGVLSVTEARHLTDTIKATADQLWRLLLEAHERRAWEALGYPSFQAYAKTEFSLSQSHCYRLVDQGRVIRALSAAAGSPIGENIVNESAARRMKGDLSLVLDDVRHRVQHGQEPLAAARDAVRASRQRYAGSLKAVDRRGNRIIENMVQQATTVVTDDTSIDFDAIDTACIPSWVQDFNASVDRIKAFVRRLEQQLARRSA
jgi:hypothetical protein